MFCCDNGRRAMIDLMGKRIDIAGMTLDIVADAGERWECRNTTTRETVLMDKSVIDRAIRLGKAELSDDRAGPE